MSGFQVMVRIGSNSVSAPLRGHRLPAIFPKRCNAGGRAASSELGLPGWWLGASSAGRGVFGAGAAGAVARRKYYIFFSWMNLPSQRLRQAEETKIPGYTGTSFLTRIELRKT